MKKLLLLFVSIITLSSCSSDDDAATPVTPTVEVISYSYEVAESNAIGNRMEYTATVKNNGSQTVSGDVKFTVAGEDTGVNYSRIRDITLSPGETKTVSGIDNPYYQGETINIISVVFEAN